MICCIFLRVNFFVQVDIERLKKDILAVLNETYFDKLNDNIATTEAAFNSKAAASGFLQAVLRRTKRLATLHSQ